ncbi:hypothetical protein CMI37_04040 [Candidatus Pacearchaeota archaeon]|nr:hypothetical protein [Candidatus Pacearchaeota archaeon]
MLRDKESIRLIESYLHRQIQKGRLIAIHDMAQRFLNLKKAPPVATTETERGKKIRGQREEKGQASGHAVYPHLRPMYRTVHRTVPRAIVFRAIRWVNPARMFPISQYDKKKLQSLSKEEFQEAFTELARYRREAHVINQRYGQMIDMIDAGQLPYYIPHANIPKQKLENLAEYRERAERLGKGASDWGWELDHKAEEFREVWENKIFEGDKQAPAIDDIDGLWEGGPPPFMRIRDGRKNKRVMRMQRRGHRRFQVKFKGGLGPEDEYGMTTVAKSEDDARKKFTEFMDEVLNRGDFPHEAASDRGKMMRNAVANGFKGADVKDLGNVKLPRLPQINVQEFVAVDQQEVRIGGKGFDPEVNRMPPLRHVKSGADVFLLRMPPSKGASFMGDKQWTNANQAAETAKTRHGWNGQVGPKKSKIQVNFRRVGEAAPGAQGRVAERRFNRVTQRSGPGGGVKHIGGPSARDFAEEPAQHTEGQIPDPPARQAQMFGRPPVTAPPKKAKTPPKPEDRAAEFDALVGSDPMIGHRDNLPSDSNNPQRDYKGQHQKFVNDIAAAVERVQPGAAIGDLFDPKHPVDVKDDDNYFTAENVAKIKPIGNVEGAAPGIRSSVTFQLTMKDGKKYVYKIQEQEWKNEFQYYALDRALGLNVAPTVTLKNLGMGLFRQIYIDGDGDPKNMLTNRYRPDTDIIKDLLDASAAGGGHIAEWVDSPDSMKGANGDRGDPKNGGLFDTQQKRHNAYAVGLLDLLTLNGDRHVMNWAPHPEKGIVPIDNGYAGNGPIYHLKSNATAVGSVDAMFPSPGNKPGGSRYRIGLYENMRVGWKAGCAADGVTRADFEKEISDWFDANWNGAAVKAVTDASGYDVRNRSYLEADKHDELRTIFVSKFMQDFGSAISRT